MNTTRKTYKPFEHQWCYDTFKLQNNVIWTPEEVTLSSDIKEWKNELTDGERHLLTQIFRFFTQGDIEVSNAYVDLFLPKFKVPEIRMMLLSFANIESIHTDAYSYLMDSIGMQESEYEAFLQYDEMVNKCEYLESMKNDNIESLLLSIAVFGGFMEGMQLFSSFCMIAFFPAKRKLLKGMGQIISWSVRDETIHTNSMCRLFLELKKNYYVNSSAIIEACKEMLDQEDKFIDLAYGLHSIEGLDKEDVKLFVRYIGKKRLKALEITDNDLYKSLPDKNPLPWFSEYINAIEFTNFFDMKPTQYAKNNSKGTWEDVKY